MGPAAAQSAIRLRKNLYGIPYKIRDNREGERIMPLETNDPMLDEELLDFQNVLLVLVRSLVDRPNDVKISHSIEQERVTFSVQAHDEDRGKLVGSRGRTARALRVIVGANAAKLRRKINLDLGRD